MEKELDFSAEIQRDIFGMQDAHVRKIEKELQVSIVSRNGTMKVVGDKNNVEAAVVLLEDMAGLSEHGSEVTSQQVDYALDMKGDAEPGMLQKMDGDIICHTVSGKPVRPKTVGQQKYINAIAPPSKRARNWDFCPVICRVRSTPICVLSTTRSIRSWVRKNSRQIWKRA